MAVYDIKVIRGISIALCLGSVSACANLQYLNPVPYIAPDSTQYISFSEGKTNPKSVSLGDQFANNSSCFSAKENGALTLTQILWRSLCNNPVTRRSWARVQSSANALGASYDAFLPSLDITASSQQGHAQQQLPMFPFENQNGYTSTANGYANFQWIFYDGGQLASQLDTAQQNSLAAEALHDVAVLSVISQVASDYFDLVAAEATVTAKEEAEQSARENYRVADGRNRGQIAPLSDVLQADTVLQQARLDSITARGDRDNKRGLLAADMGMLADTPVQIKIQDTPILTISDLGELKELIERAVKAHPSVLAAEAQYKSLQAGVALAESEGMPIISGIGQLSAGTSVGALSLVPRAKQLQGLWGIQVQIPLSKFIGRSYDMRQAEAAVSGAQADIDDAKLKVSMAVWTNFHNLRTDIDSLARAKELFSVADQSFEIAQGRYKDGIGDILQLINAQIAQSNARGQIIAITSQCMADRIKLSTALGTVDMPVGE